MFSGKRPPETIFPESDRTGNVLSGKCLSGEVIIYFTSLLVGLSIGLYPVYYVNGRARLSCGTTLSVHLYADDTQIYGSCPPSDVSSLLQQINRCDVSALTQTGCRLTACNWTATKRTLCACLPAAVSTDLRRGPDNRLDFASTGSDSLRCRSSYWRRPVDEDVRPTDSFTYTSITQYSRTCTKVRFPFAGNSTYPLPTWLLRQRASQSPC